MTQKITLGRDRRQNAIDAENAMRQAGSNQYVEGIQGPQERPVGMQVSDTRTEYGAVRRMPQELVEGPDSNFSSVSTTANVPLDKPTQTTGSVELQTSGTKAAEKDPDAFQTEALDKRLNMYAQAASNAGYSLNDRARSGRL